MIKDHEEHEADLRTLCDLLRQQRNKSSHLRKVCLVITINLPSCCLTAPMAGQE